MLHAHGFKVVSRDKLLARNLARHHVDEHSPYVILCVEAESSNLLEFFWVVAYCFCQNSWTHKRALSGTWYLYLLVFIRSANEPALESLTNWQPRHPRGLNLVMAGADLSRLLTECGVKAFCQSHYRKLKNCDLFTSARSGNILVRTSHQHTKGERFHGPWRASPERTLTFRSTAPCVRRQNHLRFTNEARVANPFHREIADDHNFSLHLISFWGGTRFTADNPLFFFRFVSRRRVCLFHFPM